jgi:hypothetical protein
MQKKDYVFSNHKLNGVLFYKTAIECKDMPSFKKKVVDENGIW